MADYFFNGTYDNDSIFQDFNNETIIEYYSFKFKVIGTFFNSIIFVVGVLGNLMVVAVVRKTRSMHSPTNCYLVSLNSKKLVYSMLLPFDYGFVSECFTSVSLKTRLIYDHCFFSRPAGSNFFF